MPTLLAIANVAGLDDWSADVVKIAATGDDDGDAAASAFTDEMRIELRESSVFVMFSTLTIAADVARDLTIVSELNRTAAETAAILAEELVPDSEREGEERTAASPIKKENSYPVMSPPPAASARAPVVDARIAFTAYKAMASVATSSDDEMAVVIVFRTSSLSNSALDLSTLPAP